MVNDFSREEIKHMNVCFYSVRLACPGLSAATDDGFCSTLNMCMQLLWNRCWQRPKVTKKYHHSAAAFGMSSSSPTPDALRKGATASKCDKEWQRKEGHPLLRLSAIRATVFENSKFQTLSRTGKCVFREQY